MLQSHQQAIVEALVDMAVQNEFGACLVLEHISSPSYDLFLFNKKPSQTQNILTNSEEIIPEKCTFPAVDPFPVLGPATSTESLVDPCGKPRVDESGWSALVSWPWLASLQYEGQHFCGDFPIDEKWIPTAVRCKFSCVMSSHPRALRAC